VSAADDDYTYRGNEDAGGLITSTSAWRPTVAPSHEYDNNSNNRSADIKSLKTGNGGTVA